MKNFQKDLPKCVLSLGIPEFLLLSVGPEILSIPGYISSQVCK